MLLLQIGLHHTVQRVYLVLEGSVNGYVSWVTLVVVAHEETIRVSLSEAALPINDLGMLLVWVRALNEVLRHRLHWWGVESHEITDIVAGASSTDSNETRANTFSTNATALVVRLPIFKVYG